MSELIYVRARKGKQLRVKGQVVTDSPVGLQPSNLVSEHLRLGRLLPAENPASVTTDSRKTKTGGKA